MMEHLRSEIESIRQEFYPEQSDRSLFHLNQEKKYIVKNLEREQEFKCINVPKNLHETKIFIPFTNEHQIIEFHDDLVNKTDLIYEEELSVLNEKENKETIESLQCERTIIMTELGKTKDQNLKNENIGKKFKYCIIKKKNGKKKYYKHTSNLFITNSYDDFLFLQNKNIYQNMTEDSFEVEVKKYVISELAYQKIVVDLTNPQKNELGSLYLRQVTSEPIKNNDLDLIDQYINIEKIEDVLFSMTSWAVIPKEIFKNLHQIKNLDIFDYFSFLDTDNFEYLKNLKVIHFLRGVQEIRCNAFNGLNNLVYLSLDYCDLTFLESGCFDGLINLKYLSLVRNRISEISEEIFSPLKNLIYLYMGDNPLEYFNPKGLNNLQYLNIDSPEFFDSSILTKYDQKQQNHHSLKLSGMRSYSNLKNVEALKSHKMIINSKNLKVLDLYQFSRENCDPNDPNIFKDLEYFKLEKLNLLGDDNFINRFNFRNLKVLVGSFEKIPKFEKSLSNLKYLVLDYVKEFDKNCFEHFINLEYLKISIDKNASLIEEIEPDHFMGIKQLKCFEVKINSGKLPDLSAKESIFENLFKPDEKLRKTSFENFYKIYQENSEHINPFEYLNVDDILACESILRNQHEKIISKILK
ncbi:chondroadherin [Brachionus plicatilis]|uniref:Chondroadherin n=1 Tax=Brachionus plicatilis TaxID=10195 RepID=A0A3M7SL00_BRAPC|nr:chondroadherin [Brachionus plicatilis]